MELTTRLADAADHASFAKLFVELGVHDPVPGAEQFARHMLPRVIMLCADGGEAIGYAFWQRYDRTAHLVQLAVAPGARGRGGGRALMDAVRTAAAHAGCTRWYLNVKRDNRSARRLYQRCGLEVEHDSWAMRIAWAQVDALVGDGEAAASTVQPADDDAIAARFCLDRQRLSLLRARSTTVLIALTARSELVGFAAFDSAFPGAYPFRVARPDLARPLFDACRVHADRARFDYLHVTVEDDASLARALAAVGAQTSFELVQMGSSLAPA